MFQRRLLQLDAVKGVIATVFDRPVYMRTNDSVTYFHTYQLEGFPENQRFTVKWRDSQAAEFKEGDFVEFQYTKECWKDRMFYSIVNGSMRSGTPPASKTQGNHYQQQQPQLQQHPWRLHSPSQTTSVRPSTQESHEVAEAHNPAAATTEANAEGTTPATTHIRTPHEIRIKALQVMRDILVMRQQWASSTTKSSAPSLEDFVKELLAGAKSIESYLTETEGSHVVGESCEGRVEPAVEGKSPLLLRKLEMPGENLVGIVSGDNGEEPPPPPSTTATPTLLRKLPLNKIRKQNHLYSVEGFGNVY